MSRVSTSDEKGFAALVGATKAFVDWSRFTRYCSSTSLYFYEGESVFPTDFLESTSIDRWSQKELILLAVLCSTFLN